MKTITRKSEIKVLLEKCLNRYHSGGLSACLVELNDLILLQKVKFPLLEYCAAQFYFALPEHEQLSFCDSIQSLKTEGGNVILGIILQKRLASDFKESIEKAIEYIADADRWYVCDIIGERVFGYALLHRPGLTIPVLKKLSNHSSHWVIRSLGAGIHYAIKKGLDQKSVKTVFELLLLNADKKDKEIRQGIGWAAKTTANFHPEIIQDLQLEIDDNDQVSNWFKRKIAIGLKRNDYAQRN